MWKRLETLDYIVMFKFKFNILSLYFVLEPLAIAIGSKVSAIFNFWNENEAVRDAVRSVHWFVQLAKTEFRIRPNVFGINAGRTEQKCIIILIILILLIIIMWY